MWILGLKGLSKSIFEPCISTGSEAFLINYALKSPNYLLSVFTLTEMICPKI